MTHIDDIYRWIVALQYFDIKILNIEYSVRIISVGFSFCFPLWKIRGRECNSVYEMISHVVWFFFVLLVRF